MTTFTANGIDIFFERSGVGPRLLLLNGSGATIDGSRPLIDLLAGSFEVAVADQRGLGRTSVPAEPFTMAEYAADAAALADHLGWDRFRAVGVSFGGMVAQELAVTWPERIERLVLACTSPGGVGGASYPLHELDALAPDARAARYAVIADTRFTPEWLAEHPSDRRVVAYQAERESAPRSDERRRGERAQLEARRLHDVGDRLHRIGCPTLVASGRFDGIAPVANGEAIVERIGANAELRVYDGGHLFFLQDRAALPEVMTFLG